MAKIFKFQAEESPEECLCEACETVNDYLHIAKEAETTEELEAILRGLYDDAYLSGFKEALQDSIAINLSMLDEIDGDIH